MKEQIHLLDKKLERNVTVIKDVREEKYKLKRRTRNLLSKIETQKNMIDMSELKESEWLKEECEMLSKDVTDLNNENKELQMLISLLNYEVIVTFEGGRYRDEIREVVMELLSLDVSMNKMNDVRLY